MIRGVALVVLAAGGAAVLPASAAGPPASPGATPSGIRLTVPGVVPRGVPDLPGRYRPPVAGPLRVVRPFEQPAGPYAAGHRGVDLATVPGQRILAPAAGTVVFAGGVAGRGVVVVVHADGVSTEYEPVRPAVSAGTAVSAGHVIATVAGTHTGCRPGRCLHWGARRGGGYFDPLRLLLPLGAVRLLPWAAASPVPQGRPLVSGEYLLPRTAVPPSSGAGVRAGVGLPEPFY